MNHCQDCGRRVDAGRTFSTRYNGKYCLICEAAQLLRGQTYASPATKRWREKKDDNQSGRARDRRSGN